MGAGTKIKMLLEDMDMKQKAFAKQVGIPEASMSNYLRETRTMPYEVLTEVARKLHTTTDYLLGMVATSAQPLALSEGEHAVLRDFRMLSKEQKELIIQNIKLMRAQNER